MSTHKQQRVREKTTPHVASFDPGLDYSISDIPETRGSDKESSGQISPGKHRNILSCIPNRNNLSSCSSMSSMTPLFTPQTSIEDHIGLHSSYKTVTGTSSSAYGSTSTIDEIGWAGLLPTGMPFSVESRDDCRREPQVQMPTSSTFNQNDPLKTEKGTPTQVQLPEILFQLQMISQSLRSCTGSEVEKDKAIEIISHLCDITKTLKSAWTSNDQGLSPNLTLLATTISIAVEICSVLADELSSICSSWLDEGGPSTLVFLRSHAIAFAIDVHLLEMKDTMHLTGLTAYDTRTNQIMDHVHTTVRTWLQSWRNY